MRRKPWWENVPTYPRVPKDSTVPHVALLGRTGGLTVRTVYTPSTSAFATAVTSQAAKRPLRTPITTAAGMRSAGIAIC
jgi:hypothetical protein